MIETTCKTCGKPIENKTKRVNPRQFCNSSCRNKHWSAMRAGRETVEIKPKKEPTPKLTNWERILAKRDPITHRYNNAPVLAPIKREV
ncbi:MAG: hypothetical protein JZU60_02005 [Ilumatobacteraceae bacterium]|nr:hypothetical protein [Ilumatobacteraceae bacterium]